MEMDHRNNSAIKQKAYPVISRSLVSSSSTSVLPPVMGQLYGDQSRAHFNKINFIANNNLCTFQMSNFLE